MKSILRVLSFNWLLNETFWGFIHTIRSLLWCYWLVQKILDLESNSNDLKYSDLLGVSGSYIVIGNLFIVIVVFNISLYSCRDIIFFYWSFPDGTLCNSLYFNPYRYIFQRSKHYRISFYYFFFNLKKLFL